MAESQNSTLVEKLHLLPPTERAILALAESVAALNATAERLVASTAGSMGCLSHPEMFSPREFSALRRDFEQGLERMIAFLDTLDGDPDIEDGDPCEEAGDEEPCLGAAEGSNQAATWRVGGHEDGEPSLGSLGGTALSLSWPQTTWGFGSRDDREEDAGDEREEENEHGTEIDHGEEDKSDDEPSLCGITVGPGDSSDREGEDDNGIADHGGLEEQAGRYLPYDIAQANRAAASDALAELEKRTGRMSPGVRGRGPHANVTVVGPYPGLPRP